MARRPIPLPPVPTDVDRPTILARVYPGYHEDAVQLFQEDAENLARHGYFPVAQSYADGRYTTWYVTLSAVLILFGIGLLLFLYMAAVKPPGTLAATFELRGARVG